MFIICYLSVALTTIAGALIGGTMTGYSAWESLGMALLAMVFLQMLILGYVVATAIRNTRVSRGTLPRTAHELRNEVFILPK